MVSHGSGEMVFPRVIIDRLNVRFTENANGTSNHMVMIWPSFFYVCRLLFARFNARKTVLAFVKIVSILIFGEFGSFCHSYQPKFMVISVLLHAFVKQQITKQLLHKYRRKYTRKWSVVCLQPSVIN